jgi:YegS/Rv2252/BmrU family lipid kinase
MECPLPVAAPTIIFNPAAGGNLRRVDENRLRKVLREEGLPDRWLCTQVDFDAGRLLEQDEGEGPVVVIGGDGTLQRASRVLANKSRPLVIVPSGTGNVMALRLGIPMGLRAALRLVKEGVPRRVDLGRSKEEPFLLAIGGGFEGHLIREAGRELKNVLGKSAYVISAAKHLPVNHHAFSITVDDAEHEITAASVMVANFGTQMGNWIFPPESDGQDGMLDVAIIRAQTFEQVVTLAAASFGARPRPHGGLTLLRGRQVTVRCEHPIPIQLDGDDQGDQREFEARIEPGGLRVLVPRRTRPSSVVWPPPLDWP